MTNKTNIKYMEKKVSSGLKTEILLLHNHGDCHQKRILQDTKYNTKTNQCLTPQKDLSIG